MKLLLYANMEKTGQRLRKQIQSVVSNQDLESCSTVGILTERLRRPVGGLTPIVILTTNRKEFEKILSIRDLLRDLKIIIIIPNRKPETLSDAHKLYPRYISSIDEKFDNTVAVVIKMLKQFHPTNVI